MKYEQSMNSTENVLKMLIVRIVRQIHAKMSLETLDL